MRKDSTCGACLIQYADGPNKDWGRAAGGTLVCPACVAVARALGFFRKANKLFVNAGKIRPAYLALRRAR